MESLTYNNHLQYQTVRLMVTAEHVSYGELSMVSIWTFITNLITINYLTSLHVR